MTPIQLQRVRIRQQKALLSMAEPYEHREISEMIFENQFRLGLLLKQKRLEVAINDDFDLITSRKLDAIQVLLDD